MTAAMTAEVRFQTVGGARNRYAGSEDSEGPAVLRTSPWPESVHAFASMWESLSQHARFFALDLPGFGAPHLLKARRPR
jgi:pimeloyl-ACP methyl ester carboxylesterase